MRLIKEEPVPLPIENRHKNGLCYRHIEVGKFGLWLRWMMQCIFNVNHDMSWSESKQLASKGKLHVRVYAGACAYPLWTNVYYLR